jgi:hypothetical protein
LHGWDETLRGFFALAVVLGSATYVYVRSATAAYRLVVVVLYLLAGSVILTACAGVLAARGIGIPTSHEIHRWSGHGTFIVAYLLALVGWGASIGRIAKHNQWRALLDAAAALVTLLALLLASFTGYLLPDDAKISEETLVRFRTMHYGVFFTFSIAALWWWSVRCRKAIRDFGPTS